jgi:hypothetical protein
MGLRPRHRYSYYLKGSKKCQKGRPLYLAQILPGQIFTLTVVVCTKGGVPCP